MKGRYIYDGVNNLFFSGNKHRSGVLLRGVTCSSSSLSVECMSSLQVVNN
jgi:hypothetical protein